LSLPFRLRLRLARNEELLGTLRRTFIAAVRRRQRQRARELGITKAEAAICFTQRYDSLLRVNPHFHALVPDVVFVENSEGRGELVALSKPTQADVESILKRIVRRAGSCWRASARRPSRRTRWTGCAAGSSRCSRRGSWPREAVGAARGFSLHAATHLHMNDREGLERMCRYALRSPVANCRLSRREDGDLVLKLKRALPTGGKAWSWSRWS